MILLISSNAKLLSLRVQRANMLNFMAVIKLNKCTFDEWKKEMEEDTEMDGLFMRDVMLAKVDDHTAILCADVFDRDLQYFCWA